MLRLRDIMTTDVLTVSPSTSLQEAADVLVSRHVGGAPVVVGDRVVGVVSATDILAFLASPPIEATEREEERESDADADPSTWQPDDPLDDDPSARFFAEQWSAADADVIESHDESARADRDPFAAYTVDDVMTRSVQALPPTADVWTAVARMREADVHRLLVMEGDTLVGIVTTTNIARALGDGRLVRRTFVFGRARRA
ncbi:CBS domain containing protein (plasmid) [Gemmatirosa kalamazoonensis]|uniref:CBS domain containing protein n=1 Tax=Gemmatirosa kalamazoonensis TaxID=861299 RepID=W0RNP2_9BACT|nr:CBS domain-containing protein [Gemmatirosa kalamazoonensis]AHG92624.1 CBS domain containing protein [Gemmatirosa kalamazoonensis]